VFDTRKAERELAELDRLDRPQTAAEQQRAQDLAQNIRLVKDYGVDPKELES
jgi:hypothetical protein